MTIRNNRQTLAVLLALAGIAFAPRGHAVTNVWTLRDIAFDDGGVISGHFSFDSQTHAVTDWSVWATGGNLVAFPLFEYRPDNSSLLQGSGGEIGFAVANTQRVIVLRPSVPLSGSPVYVPLYLDFPSTSAFEGYGNAPTIRLMQSGALFTDPAPTRVRWFLENVTFDDGGTATGYADQMPDDSGILKWSIHVSGGNEATFPPLTYTPLTSTSNIFNSAVFAVQNVHELELNASFRRARYTGAAPTRQDGGRVALDLVGSGNVECFNCSPYRTVTGGTLRGVTDEVWGDGFE